MNILILAAGTRNKIVQYFKKTLEGKGKVIATDSSRLGPALYDADDFYIVPSITAPGYIDIILDMMELDVTKAKGKTAYEEIKTSVLEHTVAICLAQVKSKT